MNVFHFYHIFSDGKWQLPLTSHISALEDSKLITKIDSMKIGISGNSKDKVLDFLDSKGITYDLLDDSDSEWEQQTLIPLHEFAKHNQGVIFYAHTKGASTPNSYSLAWRTSMTFFNVFHWEKIIEILKTNDIVGCHWIDSRIENGRIIPPFFGGNFWWANSSFISNLEKPTNFNRWDAETWLTSNFERDFPKFKDLNPGWPKDENFILGW